MDILPNKENIIQKKNEIKKKINSIGNEVKMLSSLLNEVIYKLNKYYEINENIINNYDINKSNYEIIHSLNQFENSNIIEELNKIIESNNVINKYNILYNIYCKMNIDEINIIYKVNDNKIKLFGYDFVKNNKNNCKLIIDGKEEELKEFYNLWLSSANRNTLEIKLKNITKITNMNNIFNECISLLSLPDISKWNITTVTNISGIFSECSTLSSIPDILQMLLILKGFLQNAHH